jgi:arabinose-5-phosphate isomerase
MSINFEKIRQAALRTLDIETQAIAALIPRIDASFEKACEILLACEGRIVVIGMGKSGHIGGKIAATLASTGSPAFFVHPAEASHGDLGMITDKDVVIALSNSGETSEILIILPLIKRLGVPFIGLIGNPTSTLAKAATVNLDVSVEKEACPLGLAPTASTTAALAMGDALAVALLESREFNAEDFARSHPGGRLGRRLLLHVVDLMHKNEKTPKVTQYVELKEVLLEMTRKGLGMTAIVDDENKVVGIYTDGDLRRTFEMGVDLKQTLISQIMTRNPKCVSPEMLAVDALNFMEANKINGLLVVDSEQHLIGALNMHDLLRAGVV